MGTPKALLPFAGETFLDRLVGLLAERCDPVIVVLGAGAAEIEARASRMARFVRNANYRRGQTSSMQCGLRSVPAEANGVLFTLVDHPAVSPETIAALLAPAGEGEAAAEGEAAGRPLVRVPRYRGRRGHPVWFSRELIPEFLALPDGAAARDVVHAHAERTGFLDLDDPGIVADIDDPEAYRGLLETGL
jgi:molybdenum cofactor cytidylyltransferase